MKKKETDMPKPFRVLSIDGGGMRGLYTANVLNVLAKRFDMRFTNGEQPDIGKSFNLICGTSTGAILACGLALGVPLNKIIDLYCEKGPQIFKSPMPQKKGTPKRWTLKHLKRPTSDTAMLKKELDDVFSTMTINDLYQKRKIALCIPAVKAMTHQAVVLKTPHNKGKHRDNNHCLVDVCLASSAAPIFFPISKQKNPDDENHFQYFVDGGLWANNPVMVGLVEALGMAADDVPIEIISIGTCDKPNGDPASLQNPEWGIADWKVGVGIVEMSLSAQSSGYGFMSKVLADSLSGIGRNVKVVRLEESNKSPEQYSAIGLDQANAKAIQTLKTLAEVDADHIHSKATSNNNKELRPVIEIFSNLASIKL